MKRRILLFSILASSWSINAQEQSKYHLSIEPCVGLMIKNLHYRPIEPNSFKVYQNEKPSPGIGLKISFNDLKKHVGLNFSMMYFNKISHGIEYTYSTLQPDPNVPAKSTAEFSETRLSIAPYYDFLKSSRFKLALGGIVNIYSNKFLSEKTTMQTGTEKPHSGYADEFNSGGKSSYGFYFTTGITQRHLTGNLFASYNFHSNKYFNTTETKPGTSFIIGISAGYTFLL